ncbi:MAG: Maf family protein [Bacteroidota bacterium]|nr:Maf family protein [Bacteroidota bacterium]
MINRRFQDLTLILASRSPRRQYLLKELGLEFEILTTNVDETYPEGLPPEEVANYLAKKKADSFDVSRIPSKSVIISADTIVTIDGKILGKPGTYSDAVKMLKMLSGRKHDVYTSVCLRSRNKEKSFTVKSSVFFKTLSMEEIEYYIENFQPFDKAGGYGIQEWIGYIGIEKIEGSFFNIMGLPVKELYEELLKF